MFALLTIIHYVLYLRDTLDGMNFILYFQMDSCIAVTDSS